MNQNNCGGLEACDRLFYARGIVLETEKCWVLRSDGLGGDKWDLIDKPLFPYKNQIPAPSMAEVWRELPDHIDIEDKEDDLAIRVTKIEEKTYAGYYYFDGDPHIEKSNTNPTDALIELLIWVKKEKKDA